MTDNQRMAHDELTLYRDAKNDIRHFADKIKEMESRVQRSTRSCDSIMRETWRDGKFIAVPVVVQTSHSGNAVEELMDALMDLRVHYITKQADAERLCMRIECHICDRCSERNARLIRSHFLYNQRLEKIAVDENYSYRQARRIRSQALEEYGEKMQMEK